MTATIHFLPAADQTWLGQVRALILAKVHQLSRRDREALADRVCERLRKYEEFNYLAPPLPAQLAALPAELIVAVNSYAIAVAQTGLKHLRYDVAEDVLRLELQALGVSSAPPAA